MPADAVYVFDACAVIALLQAEAGAGVVTDLLQEENRCLVHAINVCEVYYDLYRRDGEEIANGGRPQWMSCFPSTADLWPHQTPTVVS